MPKKLTDLSIKRLHPPEHGQYVAWDDLTGFGVRVSQGGSKSYIVVHGRERKKTTIGRVDVVSLKDARLAARNVLANRTLHRHLPKSVKFEVALAEFFAQHVERKNRPVTQRTTKRLLNSHFLPKFRHERLEDVSPYQLQDVITDLLETPGEAAHAKTAIQTFMRWCVRRHYLQHSPCEGLEAPRIKSRERVLTDEELRQILIEARNQGVFGRIVLGLLLSGQRETQWASLRGEWIDRETRLITFPSEVMKGKVPHTIPYGDALGELLGSTSEGLVFPSATDKQFSTWSKAKRKFDRACPLAHWTLHDLRRTLATKWAEQKIAAPHVTDALLAHKQGALNTISKTYNRYAYLDEIRLAMAKWEARLYALMPIG